MGHTYFENFLGNFSLIQLDILKIKMKALWLHGFKIRHCLLVSMLVDLVFKNIEEAFTQMHRVQNKQSIMQYAF